MFCICSFGQGIQTNLDNSPWGEVRGGAKAPLPIVYRTYGILEIEYVEYMTWDLGSMVYRIHDLGPREYGIYDV